MNFLETMRGYFRGEATEAWFFIVPSGLLLLAMGVALLWTNRTAFDWGLGVPSVVFALILGATGVGVGARTPSQLSALTAQYEAQPAAMAREELARMTRVMANFRATYYAFGALIALGLVLVYVVRREWAAGLGVSLIVGAAVGLAIDNVAERRGHGYVAALRQVAQRAG
ncbi:MAG: hypothetical protein Q8Q09_22415 [Deltaproteobacteria bacterium]|nr:hypothetical protein [Deltaproteobacteria bacterium]